MTLSTQPVEPKGASVDPVYAPAPTGDVGVDTTGVLDAWAYARSCGTQGNTLPDGRVVRRECPPLVLRAGTYRLDQPLDCRFLDGWGLHGTNTRIRWHGAGPLLLAGRNRRGHVTDLRVLGDAGAPLGPLTGLREHSAFYRFEERKADGYTAAGGGRTTYFERVHLEELAEGWSWHGDQMGDGYSFRDCHDRDVYRTWVYRNSQAVNHTVEHHESTWMADGRPDEPYFDRLAGWSTPAHPYEGALWWLQSGGDVTATGLSVIRAGATWVTEDPPQDGSHGATSNTLCVSLRGATWELRWADLGVDGNGLERVAVLRPANARPAPGSGMASQLRFELASCSWRDQTTRAGRPLVYLRNLHRVHATSSTVRRHGVRVGDLGLRTLVDARSAQLPGAYASRWCSPLVRSPVSLDGTAGDPHLVDQQGSAYA